MNKVIKESRSLSWKRFNAKTTGNRADRRRLWKIKAKEDGLV
jgi:hypothetical protein